MSILTMLIAAALTGGSPLKADAERVVNTGNNGARISLVDVKAMSDGVVCARGFRDAGDGVGDEFLIDAPHALVYGPMWITHQFGTAAAAPAAVHTSTPARDMDREHHKLWAACEAGGETG